ncbi:MAG: DUF4349 domain-containing protein [Candidatus Izemoplasmataceae bacterium]
MKRLLLSFLLAITLILSACNASMDPYPDTDPDPDLGNGETVDDMFPDPEQIHLINQPAQINRKMIYTANLGIISEDPTQTYLSILNQLLTYESFVEAESYSNQIYTVKVRVKTEHYQAFIIYMRSLGHTAHFETSAVDVTNQYSTLEARREALLTQHARILELMEAASTLNEMLTLENKLTSIETELNQIGSNLSNYDSLIEYSTINLMITRVERFELLLPVTKMPSVHSIETTKDDVIFSVNNTDENTVTINAVLFKNGVLVEEKSIELLPKQKATMSFDDLDPATEYYIQVFASQEDYQVSQSSTRTIHTDRTFFSTTAHTFKVSFNALSTILKGLFLATVAIAPFGFTAAVVFIPSKVIYNKKIKPKRVEKRREIEAIIAKRNQEISQKANQNK